MNRCGISGTELKPDEEDEGICRNCHDLLSMQRDSGLTFIILEFIN